MDYFQEILQFFKTPLGLSAAALVGIAIINFLLEEIKEFFRKRHAKTLLLTSRFSEMQEEVKKLLQKPAYDVSVGFISDSKENKEIMREMGFNVEEINIQGKKENQVFDLLRLKDIIFVESQDFSYLYKAMRKCHFEKIIIKLLKEGKVYIGESAGSVVAGKEGLKLVPFNIFPHYTSESAEIVRKKMRWKLFKNKKLKILTDQQAILVQGSQVSLIGKGERVVF